MIVNKLPEIREPTLAEIDVTLEQERDQLNTRLQDVNVGATCASLFQLVYGRFYVGCVPPGWAARHAGRISMWAYLHRE